MNLVIGVLTLAVCLVAVPLTAMQSGSAEYNVVAVDNGATLAGRVVFEGRAPRPSRLLITKDIQVCGQGYRERKRVETTDDGGLSNVVVFIEGIAEGKAWPDADTHAMDQLDCYFNPHVMIAPWGAELDIINSDPVLHNIHAYEMTGQARRTLFNLGQPPEREHITHDLRPRRGRQLRLECDAHDFMLGWIYVTDNPYAVVVDADGGFVIEGVPPGAYAVKAWHPYLGMKEMGVTLAADEGGEVEFRFSN